MLTVGNLLCGMAAVLTCAGPRRFESPEESIAVFSTAAWLILVALIFDALDGRVARFTRVASEFGGQLDSLADVITFGLAPGALVYLYIHDTIGAPFNSRLLLYFVAAVFPMCAALRLARFNVENEPDEQSHRFFKGLPAPAAAGAIASTLLVHLWMLRHFGFYQGRDTWLPTYVLPLMLVALALLMVSTWRYSHIANKVFGQQRSFFFMVLFIFLCIVSALLPEVMIALVFLVYAVSGVVGFALDRIVDIVDYEQSRHE